MNQKDVQIQIPKTNACFLYGLSLKTDDSLTTNRYSRVRRDFAWRIDMRGSIIRQSTASERANKDTHRMYQIIGV